VVGCAVPGNVDYALDLCHGAYGIEVGATGDQVAASQDAADNPSADAGESYSEIAHGGNRREIPSVLRTLLSKERSGTTTARGYLINLGGGTQAKPQRLKPTS